MNIAVDLLYLIPGHVGGTETYAISLLNALIEEDESNEYFVFGNRALRKLDIPEEKRVRKISLPFNPRWRIVRYFWQQFLLPIYLSYYGVDLLHSPAYVTSLLPGIPIVVTIHDVNFLALRDVLPFYKSRILGWFVKRSAERAEKIITVSDFSCSEILNHMAHIDERKIHVIPEASKYDAHDRRLQNHQLIPLPGLVRPYLIAFSSPFPHKNISRLIRAYAKIAHQIEHCLVLVGSVADKSDILKTINNTGLSERIILTGYVGDDILLPLLKKASVMIFPSWYEGFGLPVLEAQQLGTPVVCSNAASLPEIAGEGAVYFDPYSIDDIADSVLAVLKSKHTQERLTSLGTENAARYSWEKAARITLDVYRLASSLDERC